MPKPVTKPRKLLVAMSEADHAALEERAGGRPLGPYLVAAGLGAPAPPRGTDPRADPDVNVGMGQYAHPDARRSALAMLDALELGPLVTMRRRDRCPMGVIDRELRALREAIRGA